MGFIDPLDALFCNFLKKLGFLDESYVRMAI